MKTKLLFLLALGLSSTSMALGEPRIVKGQVLSDSDGEPMIGVAISEKGTTNGTITDADGNFSINVQDGAVLTISYMGYTTQNIKPGNGPIKIELVEDNKMLDDVVVIGYGVQRKSDLTGSVASIKADDIKNLSTPDAAAALQGKATGVQIINTGGPGKGAKIRVRGYSSNSDKIDPLYIVDGMKVDNIQFIDPSIIESIEVLKDAASAAIYGAAAGNGVVIITTKKGTSGGPNSHINYEFKAINQSLGKKAELFDAPEYIEYQKYLGYLTDETLKSKGYNGQNTDWYDEVFDNSWALQHTVSVSGSNKNGSFMASLNLLDDDGIVKGDKDTYKRLTAFVNADYSFFKWMKISSNNSLEKWKTTSVGNGYASFLNSVVSIDPLTPAYVDKMEDMGINMEAQWNTNPETHGNVPVAPNGKWYGTSKYVEDATGNPLGQRDRINEKNSGYTLRGVTALDITPLSGLVITSRIGYRLSTSNNHNYQTPYWLSSMAHSESYTLAAGANTGFYYQWENFINYNKKFGKHDIGAMAGISFEKNYVDNVSISVTDSKPILKSPESNFRYVEGLLSDVPKSITNSYGQNTSYSQFGRLTYNYDNRYGLQFNFRHDAFDLTKLSTRARWGNFPSVSAGWTLSNESFFKDIVSEDAVSFMKFRASWGRNGNVNILTGFPWTQSINKGSGYYYFSPESNDGTMSYGGKPDHLANPDLHWEISEQVDLGLDARFLNDRLTVGFDYFNKLTRGLLISCPPACYLGYANNTQNIGQVLNRGIELELAWRDDIEDFHYEVLGNISTLKNEVKRVAELVPRLEDQGISGFNNKLKPAFETGHPVWFFRGFKYAGVDRETGEAQYYDKDGNITKAPGEEDKQYLGEGIPNFTYGITINLAWKGIDLTVFGTGAAGNEIYNLMVSADRPQINGIDTYWKDSWKKAGDNAKYPDMKKVARDWNFFSSDAAIFNGSYFKFKQIQLGYTLPTKISKKVALSKARIYMSLDDFFVITKYPGADPETSSFNAGAARGFDNGNYPTPKKMIFGVNLTL